MGITVISNYDKVKDMEVTINRLELTADAEEEVAQVMNNPKENYQDVTVENSGDTSVTEGIIGSATDVVVTSEIVTTENITTEQVLEGTVEELSTEQAIPVVNQQLIQYTIQNGDTLGTIALEFYGDVQYAENIAQANNMSINDKIYENQIIVIPEIE